MLRNYSTKKINLYISDSTKYTNMRNADKKAILFILFSMMLSLIYVVYRWPYTPETVIKDLEYIGPFGILLDLAILLFFFLWIKNRRNQKQDNL